MFKKRDIFKILGLYVGLIVFIILWIEGLIISPSILAQNWAILPPYNVLWPLWYTELLPSLSPPDPVTGLPIPLLTELTGNTILPIEPVLVWDPHQEYPC